MSVRPSSVSWPDALALGGAQYHSPPSDCVKSQRVVAPALAASSFAPRANPNGAVEVARSHPLLLLSLGDGAVWQHGLTSTHWVRVTRVVDAAALKRKKPCERAVYWNALYDCK